MKKFMKKLIILVSFIFMSSTLFAQTLNVKGLVTDAVTGETLLGVNVIVKILPREMLQILMVITKSLECPRVQF